MKEEKDKSLKSLSDWQVWTVVVAIIIATTGLIVFQKYYGFFVHSDEISTDSDQSEDISTVSSIFDWQKSASVWGGLSSHSSVVFQDKMWIMGGKNKDGLPTNDVWFSSDGVSWTKATSNISWPVRSSHQSIVFDNKIWIMGGISSAGEQLNDVWSSTDGSSWSNVTDAATWPVRADFSSIVFDNKIFVMGGWSATSPQGGEVTDYNDVWSSADGKHWEQVTADAGWPKRANFSAYVYDKKMFVIGGLSPVSQTEFSDIYSSSDGKAWTKVGDLPEARGAGAVVSADGSLYFIDGYDNTQAFGYSFFSKDGINWSQADNAYEGPAKAFHTALYFKDKIWLIGGSDFTADRVNDLWSTSISETN